MVGGKTRIEECEFRNNRGVSFSVFLIRLLRYLNNAD